MLTSVHCPNINAHQIILSKPEYGLINLIKISERFKGWRPRVSK